MSKRRWTRSPEVMFSTRCTFSSSISDILQTLERTRTVKLSTSMTTPAGSFGRLLFVACDKDASAATAARGRERIFSSPPCDACCGCEAAPAAAAKSDVSPPSIASASAATWSVFSDADDEKVCL